MKEHYLTIDSRAYTTGLEARNMRVLCSVHLNAPMRVSCGKVVPHLLLEDKYGSNQLYSLSTGKINGLVELFDEIGTVSDACYR